MKELAKQAKFPGKIWHFTEKSAIKQMRCIEKLVILQRMQNRVRESGSNKRRRT